jgi:hypothetical protein
MKERLFNFECIYQGAEKRSVGFSFFLCRKKEKMIIKNNYEIDNKLFFMK